MLELPLNIDKSWTLFLDRDGVINHRLIGDYVKTVEEFELLPGVKDALSVFKKVFGRMVIVTNQQGIAKGLMSEQDLSVVHEYFLDLLEKPEYKPSSIYYCPHMADENCVCRKPNIGMATQAKNDYPEIDFNKSIMIGDSPSDIEFGKNAGMYTVFIDSSTQLSDVAEWLMDNKLVE